MEHSLRKKTSKKWYTDSLTVSIAILIFSLFVNLLSVYYVMTVPRRVETITINRLDNSVDLHGKVTGKSMVGKFYTLDCGAYGKFLVSKEQYDSVKVGDEIPNYLKEKGN
ncbi:DUF1372 family protein [Streptococcus thermophilus]|uniref:DUF1372 family protein n=1 Tax=Streptococcus thermophilus TaxID=1308 RepID=UPI0021A749F6|nr:DUF1372 family protein [Streptococcus thermophilus]MCT2951083.1 DUF1372 family protein [Streptococcus thermophilus]MCT2951457.1 DUF1372 family protein [Streptococcus thermophilus]MCT2951490.1 DUF1372 family protein [Streptococcus thermophilus]MCT2951544.1 DUF1372 family protein [Streptococcus thermophilus]